MKRTPFILFVLIGFCALAPTQAGAVSAQTTRFVSGWEGFSATPYICPSGYLTIGYGHRIGRDIGQRWSRARARRVLRSDLEWADKAVRSHIDVRLDGDQMTALISFTFNVGSTALQTSTLRRLLNRGYYDRVPRQLRRWVHDDRGRPIPGLVRRRAAEARLFGTTPPPPR